MALAQGGGHFPAGVRPYSAAHYYAPGYAPAATDIVAAFRLTPSEGVPPEEAAAAVAAESSTGTWTAVWSDNLADIARYSARCYRVDPVPGREGSASRRHAPSPRVPQHVPRAAPRDRGGARQAQQVRPASPGGHHEAQTGALRQELRPDRVRGAQRWIGLHQGR